MEKKNTVLLTVIAVATLLVAVVGATFAYFTAQTQASGTGNATNVSTRAEVGGASLVLATVVNDGNIQYPAGYLVNGASVTATRAAGNASDNYSVTYTLNGTITNRTDTVLNYKVYQSTTEVTSNPVTGCTARAYTSGSNTNYTYLGSSYTASTTNPTTFPDTHSTCTLAAGIVGTEIASGTVPAKANSVDGTATITINPTAGTNDPTTYKTKALSTASTGETVYYYLVVEYPDTENPQTPVPTTGEVGSEVYAITAVLSSVSSPVASAS